MNGLRYGVGDITDESPAEGAGGGGLYVVDLLPSVSGEDGLSIVLRVGGESYPDFVGDSGLVKVVEDSVRLDFVGEPELSKRATRALILSGEDGRLSDENGVVAV